MKKSIIQTKNTIKARINKLAEQIILRTLWRASIQFILFHDGPPRVIVNYE